MGILQAKCQANIKKLTKIMCILSDCKAMAFCSKCQRTRRESFLKEYRIAVMSDDFYIDITCRLPEVYGDFIWTNRGN